MLPPDYFTNKEDRLLELYRQLEDFILKDITRRLLSAGEMTATTDRLIWKLKQMGESQAAIEQKLRKLTGLTRKELHSLLQDAVLTSWEDDVSTLNQLKIELTNPLENAAVIRVMDAEYKKSLKELQNLTRTTMEQATRIDLINMLDEVDLRVAAGVQSYSAAVCDILDRYAGKGIEVSYPTGAKRTLEAAVRMCVVTSMNQTAAQVTNQYIVEAQSEYVLVSAHLGARVQGKGQPELAGHDNWQGKVYRIKGSEPQYPNLLESTGYDVDPETGSGKVVNPLGLHGYNCRHSHKPWDIRLRNPYVDENGNLKIDSEENRKCYELQQKQRAMERSIRATKRKLVEKQEQIELVTDPELKEKLQNDYDKLAYKMTQQNKVYNDFCKENDLQPQYDRIKVADFNRKQSAKANRAAARYENQEIELQRQAESLDVEKKRQFVMNDSSTKGNRYIGTNTIFEQKSPLEKCNIAKELTEKYVSRESKWKGTVKVDDKKCENDGIAGRKEWSCEILVSSKSQPKTYIHEMLHSRSGSYLNPVACISYKKMEEASTELLARQVCYNENISYVQYENVGVDALRKINNIVGIESSDLQFAQRLYNQDIRSRFIWLQNKCNKFIQRNPEKKEELYSLLNELRGF